jgi:hypothetical protein
VTAFVVTGYYGERVQPPKQQGRLAASAWCYGESTKDMEVSAFMRRNDIGRVRVDAFDTLTEAKNFRAPARVT